MLCSSDPSGSQGNGSSYNPQITPDGRYVVFRSGATNLATPATTGWQAFRKDLTNDTVVLCSSDPSGSQGNGDSYNPQITPDGRYVVFHSGATNLVTPATTGWQVFRKDLALPATTWYLAEGYTGGDFDTWVLVQNPGAEDAIVTLDFQLPPGSSANPYSFLLPAGTRQSIHLDILPGLSDTDVSTKVTSDKPVVAERAEYFIYDGKPGGHDSVGYAP